MPVIATPPFTRHPSSRLRLALTAAVLSGGIGQPLWAADGGTDTVLDTVTVSTSAPWARAPKVAGGALGSRSDLETPFSTQTVTAQQIQERQATSIGKLFADDPSVEAKGNTYSMSAYALNVRGLRLDFTNGYKLDGHPFQMYGVELPLELFDNVQLLKGATGFLYGIGAPGGIVNYVSKKPTEQDTLSVSLGYSSDSLFKQALDAGGRFGADRRLGYRFNAVQEQGETYNGTHLERSAASLYLDARLNPDLTWYANGFFQERDLDGGITSFNVPTARFSGTSLPAAISGRKDLTAYDSSYYNSTAWLAATGLKWQLSDNWSLDTSYAHTLKRINSRAETVNLLDGQGNYYLGLNPFYQPTLTYDDIQSRLEGDVQTGPLAHHLVLGVGLQWLSRDLNQTSAQEYIGAGGATGNLNAGAPQLTYTGYSPRKFFEISTYEQRSVFASDTINFNDQWSVLLGARYMDYQNDNYLYSGASSSKYHEQPTTPTYALMYSPRADTTFYASYVEALEDGGTVGTTYANANEVLAPLKSKQYELGFKTQRTEWSAAAALFRIEKGAKYANANNALVADGTLRYDGAEANAQYHFATGTTLAAGATYLHARYLEAAANITDNAVEAVPRWQGNVRVNQEIPAVQGLQVHADAHYTGEQYLDTGNNLQVPSFVVYSLGASYSVPMEGHRLTYRAELNNVANREYWVASAANTLEVGAPRSLSLNVQLDF